MTDLLGLVMSSSTLITVTATVSAAAAVYWAATTVLLGRHFASLRVRAEKLRAERDKSIEWAKATFVKTPEDERRKIAKLSYPELKKALKAGEVTAVAALCTYLELAVRSHEKTNCITRFLEDSLALAENLDASGDKTKLLFGIPFSVKESTAIAGRSATYGGAIEIPAYKLDALIYAGYKANGGVPFVLTTVPLALLACETVSAVFGTTSNPFDATRAAGGSSGGEGAIIGSGGSLLGIGSDIAGSIRVPTAWCGIAGIKTTTGRNTLLPTNLPTLGLGLAHPAEGPMASCMEAVVDGLRVTFTKEIHEVDVYAAPVPWREEMFADREKKYTIGYFYDFSPSRRVLPSQRRAVEEAKAALEKAGHRLVPFELPGAEEIAYRYVKGMAGDDARRLALIIDYNLIPPEYANHPLVGQTGVLNRLATRAKAAFGLAAKLNYTAVDAAENTEYLLIWKQTVQLALREQRIDALLLPAVIAPPLKHGTITDLLVGGVEHTMLANLLNYPAGCVRVGTYNEKDAASLAAYAPANAFERRLVADTAEGAIGLPLSVQIAAPPYRDEIVARLLTDIEEKLEKV